MVCVPDSSSAADAPRSGLVLDRAGLAERAGVPAFVVDLVIDAGLITPLDNGSDGERFDSDDVEMLVAARTLVGEGVAVEELAALAMRHATNVENLIEDAIDLVKRHFDREGRDKAALVASVNRLVPVATNLVVGHFEKTLWARAMARIGDDPAPAVGAVVVKARRIGGRVDPLAAYAAATSDQHRSVWLRPDASMGLAAFGVVETIRPVGSDRFSAASAARAVLAARIRRDPNPDAPAPVLVGGFSFTPTGADTDSQQSDPGNGEYRHPVPKWTGFGDCRMVLPELTIIDHPDGAWVLAATRVGSDGDETAAEAALDQRLTSFQVKLPLPATGDPARPASATIDCDRDDDYAALVADAVAGIHRGEFQKVVLARTVTLDHGLDVAAVLDRLRQRNPACAIFAVTAGESTFLGATPEELVTLDGPRLNTVALAGTAPCSDDPEADERFGAALLTSAKNRAEHRFVVDGIIDALSGLGLVDPAPAEPGLMRLSRVQHLRTPITARVQRRRTGASDMDVLRAAGVLHPTAAVGGAPTGAALEFIAGREGFDRGWYAAPVGWCDLDGNGEMGVALRCALTGPDSTHLFAGAGIVTDSDPEDELEETAMKLRALLDVIDEC
ncbi:MAG: isochorismate synthase [Acidimicrobiaceae bacterium]|nr:isochorismate synthase [Acidimicrobiaceae bacterium]